VTQTRWFGMSVCLLMVWFTAGCTAPGCIRNTDCSDGYECKATRCARLLGGSGGAGGAHVAGRGGSSAVRTTTGASGTTATNPSSNAGASATGGGAGAGSGGTP
jgi:hypothetical protein